MRSPEGLARRRLSQKAAAEAKRRASGIAPRGKLSPEQERERSRQYSKRRRDDPAKKSHDLAVRRAYISQKRKDPTYRLIASLRSRISTEINGKFSKPFSTVAGLGCSFAELKIYLESKFQPGMTWENYGRHGWHLDHIRAVCEFDLSDPAQFSVCFHHTNLQPLWAEDNLAKEHKRRRLSAVAKDALESSNG